MALQDQNVSISFNKGLNTKSDDKQTLPGELLVLENGVFTQVNAINQDPGYLPIPGTTYNSAFLPSVGNSLDVFNEQLVRTDGNFVYSFSETTQSWSQVPTKIAHSISSMSVGPNAVSYTPIGISKSASGLEFYTYAKAVPGSNEIQAIYTTILDPVEGTILYSKALTINGFTTAVGIGTILLPTGVYSVVFGTEFTSLYTAFGISNTHVLFRVAVSETAPPQTLTASPLLTFNIVAGVPDVVQDATNYFVLYVNTGGNLVIDKYSPTSTLVTTVTIAAYVAITMSLVIDPATGNLYATYTNGTSVRMATYTNNLVVIQGDAPVIPAIGSVLFTALTGVVVSPTNYFLYASGTSTVPGYFDTYVYSVNTTGAPVGTQVEFIYDTYLSTKAYIYNNKPTVNLGFYDYSNPAGTNIQLLNQSVYFTIQQSPTAANFTLNIPYTIISKFSEGTAGTPSVVNPSVVAPIPPSQVLSLSNAEVIIPYLNSTQTEIDSNVTTNIYNVFRLDSILGTKLRAISLGNNLNFTGGVITIYDGLGLAESGYHVFPSQAEAVFSIRTIGAGVAPPSLSGGTYSYCFTYEWTDNFGQLHRSAPSIAATGVATAPSGSNQISEASITVNGTALSESYKIFNIQVVMWRTQVNGTIFYRISSLPNVAGQMTFGDSQPDVNIIQSTQLYTTGGEVDNIGPPGSDIIFPYKNRLIAVDSDNPLVWWYSKQVLQGFPVEFSDLFTSNIDMTGGPISAGSTMDDKLIFFKNSSIFYVIGDGPAPNGSQNDFSYPQVITSDVGCTNQDSIIVIPLGLIFQSTDKGIYLLTRGLQLVYIGAQVEEFNNFMVTSAVLLPNTTQIRLSLDIDVVLIYDYLVSQWSSHKGIEFVDSTIYEQRHAGLLEDAMVIEQTPDQWIDIASPLPLNLKTGWFSFAQLQGYQRVREFLLLLTSVNATSIEVSVSINFDPAFIQTDVIPITANTIRQQFRVFPIYQKAQSVQITITEVPTGSSGGGMLLSGLAFIVGVKKGLNKMPAAVSYG